MPEELVLFCKKLHFDESASSDNKYLVKIFLFCSRPEYWLFNAGSPKPIQQIVSILLDVFGRWLTVRSCNKVYKKGGLRNLPIGWTCIGNVRDICFQSHEEYRSGYMKEKK